MLKTTALLAALLLLGGCGPQTAGHPTPGQPGEVVLSPTPSATPAPAGTWTPSQSGPEWQRNLRPAHQAFALNRPVPLMNMETGQVMAQVGPDTITVDYETVVGGRGYWMTGYSVSRALPNGFAKSDVEAAVNAPPPQSRPGVPPSLAGAEWTRLPTSRQVVALTFDAGGNSAGVASILATLAHNGLPGTFFMTGRWAEAYPTDARHIGIAYTVGNHTYSHPHLPSLIDAQVADQVTRGAQAILSAAGRDPRPLFRFPYGDADARTLGILHGLGYGGIRWTVDTWGWKGRGGGQSADSVLGRVLDSLQPGEIVLMHVGGAEDGSTLDADALPRVIAGVRARGFAFVAIADFI